MHKASQKIEQCKLLKLLISFYSFQNATIIGSNVQVNQP